MPLTNVQISELLARSGLLAEGHAARAYQRASRAALGWAEEASDLINAGRSPQELERVGPSLSRRIREWIEADVEIPDPPGVRAGFSGLARARRTLAAHPEWRERYRGDLHMHSSYSDGKATIEEMAITSAQRGYGYVAMADHSKGLRVPRGMDEEVLARQGEEIAAVNERLEPAGIQVLRAIELNIAPDGSGDMDAPALESLDLVIGSFHSELRVTEDQTERYLAALRNPHLDILGHPQGRMYGRRTGLVAQWERVFEEAVKLGKAVEVDSLPDRQDLSVPLLRLAADAGCYVSIDTDAHDPEELRYLDIGLSAALAAGVRPDRVLNFMGAEELRAWARR
ncbi:MAG: PHP domain-containing protein [Actinomycetota bacterium]